MQVFRQNFVAHDLYQSVEFDAELLYYWVRDRYVKPFWARIVSLVGHLKHAVRMNRFVVGTLMVVRVFRHARLATEALDLWLKGMSTGMTIEKVTECLDATQRFYEAMGYDWDAKLMELDKLYETATTACNDNENMLISEHAQLTEENLECESKQEESTAIIAVARS